MTGRREPRRTKYGTYEYTSYLCWRGRYDSSHSRPYMVNERVVLPWGTPDGQPFYGGWTLTVPPEGALGNYSVSAVLESERPKAPAPEDEDRGRVGETRLGMSCCRASCVWLNYRERAAAFDRF